MSVDVVKARLVALCKELTVAYTPGAVFTANQLRTVYSVIQRAVQDADLPAINIIPGPAPYDNQIHGSQLVQEDRTWYVDYLFSRAGTGMVGENETAIEAIFTPIRDFFLARPGLWDALAVQPEDVEFDSTIVGDSGYTIIDYSANKYEGIRFTLKVTDLARVSHVG